MYDVYGNELVCSCCGCLYSSCPATACDDDDELRDVIETVVNSELRFFDNFKTVGESCVSDLCTTVDAHQIFSIIHSELIRSVDPIAFHRLNDDQIDFIDKIVNKIIAVKRTC